MRRTVLLVAVHVNENLYEHLYDSGMNMQIQNIRWSYIARVGVIILSMLPMVQAQKVVRITDTSAINPVEVSIAINPAHPDNMIDASLQIGRPPKPRAGSYH
jgi:hypothetical protein